MKDVLITKDKNGGTVVLTTDSPLSCYGLPILRVDTLDISEDFGPSDIVDIKNPAITAAHIVATWASEGKRTAAELKAASAFLQQWPEGPQA